MVDTFADVTEPAVNAFTETLFMEQFPVTPKVPVMDAFCKVVCPVTPKVPPTVVPDVALPMVVVADPVTLIVVKPVAVNAFMEQFPITANVPVIDAFCKVVCPVAINVPPTVVPEVPLPIVVVADPVVLIVVVPVAVTAFMEQFPVTAKVPVIDAFCSVV